MEVTAWQLDSLLLKRLVLGRKQSKQLQLRNIKPFWSPNLQAQLRWPRVLGSLSPLAFPRRDVVLRSTFFGVAGAHGFYLFLFPTLWLVNKYHCCQRRPKIESPQTVVIISNMQESSPQQQQALSNAFQEGQRNVMGDTPPTSVQNVTQWDESVCSIMHHWIILDFNMSVRLASEHRI